MNKELYIALIIVIAFIAFSMPFWGKLRTGIMKRIAIGFLLACTLTCAVLLVLNHIKPIPNDMQYLKNQGDDEAIPQEVRLAAESQVSNTFNQYIESNEGIYDDWRITCLSHIGTYTAWGPTIDVYHIDFEYHAINSDGVKFESSMYISNDGWVGGLTFDDCPYLTFLQTSDGLKELECCISDGYYIRPDDLVFYIGICRTLLVNEVISLSCFSDHDIYLMFHSNYEQFAEDLACFTSNEQEIACTKLINYIANEASTEEQQLFSQDISNLDANCAQGAFSNSALDIFEIIKRKM